MSALNDKRQYNRGVAEQKAAEAKGYVEGTAGELPVVPEQYLVARRPTLRSYHPLTRRPRRWLRQERRRRRHWRPRAAERGTGPARQGCLEAEDQRVVPRSRLAL